MNLVKLLTVGRSLNGGKVVPGNYKLQQISLPKFSSTVRPSRSAAAKASTIVSAKAVPQMDAPTPIVALAPVVAPSPLEPTPSGLDKTQKIPSGKILKRKATSEISFKVKIVMWLKMKMAALKKRLFPVRSRKKSGIAPTQAEWNLEKVTVARNDLSDADLEVLTPATVVKSQPHKAHLSDLDRVKNSGFAWIKKTTGLFKTTSPFEASPSAKTAKQSEGDRRKLAERM